MHRSNGMRVSVHRFEHVEFQGFQRADFSTRVRAVARHRAVRSARLEGIFHQLLTLAADNRQFGHHSPPVFLANWLSPASPMHWRNRSTARASRSISVRASFTVSGLASL